MKKRWALLCFLQHSENNDYYDETKNIDFIIDFGTASKPIGIKTADWNVIIAKEKKTVQCGPSGLLIRIEMLIVDNIAYNLLSVQNINKAGFRVIFVNNRVELVQNNMKLSKGK